MTPIFKTTAPTRSRFAALTLAAMAAWCASAWFIPANAVEYQRETLVLITASGQHKFQVEVADTPRKRQRGLMFRRTMAKNHGMIFNYNSDGEIVMWMKNTIISLDMVFIEADGRVSRISSNTTPYSEKNIRSFTPVRAVLELNGGTAARIGLKPGDKVVHAIFKKHD